MYFLQNVKWLEIKDGQFSDYGWASVNELNALDPEKKLNETHITAIEYVNPLGTVYFFMVRKTCPLIMSTQEMND